MSRTEFRFKTILLTLSFIIIGPIQLHAENLIESGKWIYFSDNVMGGISEGASEYVIEQSGKAIRLYGEVSTKNNGGFIQVRMPYSIERASEQICLLVQVETMEAIEQLDAIALTPGIDGVFIGPADLSASMGYPGEINHPEVVKVILDAISKLNSLNVPSGILTLDFDSAKRYINAGTNFTAVGVDMVLLAESTRNLRKQFK